MIRIFSPDRNYIMHIDKPYIAFPYPSAYAELILKGSMEFNRSWTYSSWCGSIVVVPGKTELTWNDFSYSVCAETDQRLKVQFCRIF